ncbi:conserved hypothetical protein [Uncinocarpus reesii 1704]|uniref:MARVEL domain-containing protein n=1 Tax=Uncinocarpus reesii (strain UAMH 1704) TaxID=336963 RepID=C4JMM5_UNCRE|nr:uncharacterized protein UREG_04083 [Uncinocarpus reesii 1704]EEP79237.1 conserved hypothetical protein [Uncinocarpus reesii 1704]
MTFQTLNINFRFLTNSARPARDESLRFQILAHFQSLDLEYETIVNGTDPDAQIIVEVVLQFAILRRGSSWEWLSTQVWIRPFKDSVHALGKEPQNTRIAAFSPSSAGQAAVTPMRASEQPRTLHQAEGILNLALVCSPNFLAGCFNLRKSSFCRPIVSREQSLQMLGTRRGSMDQNEPVKSAGRELVPGKKTSGGKAMRVWCSAVEREYYHHPAHENYSGNQKKTGLLCMNFPSVYKAAVGPRGRRCASLDLYPIHTNGNTPVILAINYPTERIKGLYQTFKESKTMENGPVSLGLRGVQAVFGIIVLGLTAYIASELSFFTSDIINFMIFNGVWTAFIVVPYMILAPMFFPIAAHLYAIIAVDAVTMIFWFAGFIALAARIPTNSDCNGNPICGSYKAATAFGAFEWALFVATLVLVVLPVVRNRGGPKPNEGVAPAV